MLHSAGKTSIKEMKLELAEGKRIQAHVPGGGGGKPDKPLGDDTGTEEPPVLVQNPPPTAVIAPIIVKTIQSSGRIPTAEAIALATTVAAKRDYGYVLSYIPFGASIATTLDAIGG